MLNVSSLTNSSPMAIWVSEFVPFEHQLSGQFSVVMGNVPWERKKCWPRIVLLKVEKEIQDYHVARCKKSFLPTAGT